MENEKRRAVAFLVAYNNKIYKDAELIIFDWDTKDYNFFTRDARIDTKERVSVYDWSRGNYLAGNWPNIYDYSDSKYININYDKRSTKNDIRYTGIDYNTNKYFFTIFKPESNSVVIYDDETKKYHSYHIVIKKRI